MKYKQDKHTEKFIFQGFIHVYAVILFLPPSQITTYMSP